MACDGTGREGGSVWVASEISHPGILSYLTPSFLLQFPHQESTATLDGPKEVWRVYEKSRDRKQWRALPRESSSRLSLSSRHVLVEEGVSFIYLS